MSKIYAGPFARARVMVARSGIEKVAILRGRYEQTGDVEFLRTAARNAVTVVRLIPTGHPEKAAGISALTEILSTLIEVSRDAESLRQAVICGRMAAEASRDDDPGLAMLLAVVGGSLLQLGLIRDDAGLLAEARAAGQKAVQIASADDPDRGIYMTSLCYTLLTSARLAGDLVLMEEAARVGRAALDVVPDDHPARFMVLTNLAATLRNLAELNGQPAMLEEAIALARAAVAASPGDHPAHVVDLSGLASALLRSYEATGDLTTLAEAIQVGRAAEHKCPDEHPARATVLSNLGNGLIRMFERTGDTQMLNEAVTAGRGAVAACPDGHPDKAMYLGNLGMYLARVFERSNDPAVLAEAVLAASEALAAVPGDAPASGNRADTARFLGNLATLCLAAYSLTDEDAAIAEALRAGSAAVAAASDDNPEKPTLLSNLALALLISSGQDRSAAKLNEAVATARQAVSASPDDHPDLARNQFMLGLCLLARHEEHGTDPDLVQAREHLAAALGSPTAPIRMRIDAGQWQARADTAAGDDDAALAAMRSVIDLMPLLAPRALHRADRQFKLGDQAGIGAQGAAAALSAGNPEVAVELLEQARGLLLAETMGTRSESASLRRLAPDLADEFQQMRSRFTDLNTRQVTSPFVSATQSGPLGAFARGESPRQSRIIGDELRRLAADWDALIVRIHARPGLAGFLMPPPISALSRCAADGTIVLVTADQSRCDALIVTADQDRPVRHVQLTTLTTEIVQEQVDRLTAACDEVASGSFVAEAEISQILGWLWDTIAEPILADLGHAATPAGNQWPRLWWCPVGPMAFLPLHAAGHHSDAVSDGATNPRTVLDRVISSYTATIRALEYSRIRSNRMDTRSAASALIVGMPSVAGASALPGVSTEISELTRLLPGNTLLTGSDAIRQAVLDALPGHAIAHFACHSLSDTADPAASCLMLADYVQHPLTVTLISELDLAGARLAYLSACATSHTAPNLADEAIHITAAFQLAGYSQVVGTLWPIRDPVARTVAAGFYNELTSHGTAPPNTADTALALHRVTRRMRAKYRNAPSQWAAHIHAGS